MDLVQRHSFFRFGTIACGANDAVAPRPAADETAGVATRKRSTERRSRTLADLRKAAGAHKGRCLSRAYAGMNEAHEWRCAKGHVFEMRALAVVKNGAWCRTCSGQRPHTLESMQALAKQRGGKCLSKRYESVDKKLRWQCAAGHVWESIPYLVLGGAWCPACRSGRLPPAQMLAQMRKTARQRGGKCLADGYVRAKHPYEWQCGKGHHWTRDWDGIQSGAWCPLCRGHLPPEEALAQLRAIAKQRGGVCVSKRYVDSTSELQWRCSEGHRWRTSASNVRSGRWCAKCAGIAPVTLREAQQLARSRGGKCLAKQLNNSSESVRWRCEDGHIWSAPVSRVKNANSWCPECARKPRYTLEDMQALAEKRGGHCVSRRFRSVNHHLVWRCSEGHEWRATGGQLLNSGTWCPVCWGRQLGSIAQMRSAAKARGGKCLSTKYTNSTTKLRWRCGQGHEFLKEPVSVNRGNWCPYCQRRGAKGIGEFLLAEHKRVAKQRGGECLSDAYHLASRPLRWRCQQGHEFSATSASVKMGAWCPECAHTRKPKLAEIQALAKKRGGKCESTQYVNCLQRMIFVCKYGHRWETRPSNIRRGNWCPKCARGARRSGRSRVELSIEDMQLKAEERGGVCLSQEYDSQRDYLQWRCGIGHEWEAQAGSVYAGSWCPDCSGRRPLTLDEMQLSAESRGGRCVSKAYRGVRIKLTWECADGHRWRATPQSHRSGSWCPRCLDTPPDLGIARVSALARRHGGLCLSPNHPYASKPLRWKCARGHVWRALESTVRAGKWCPRCLD